MKTGSASILTIYVKDGHKFVQFWEWDIDESDVKYNARLTVNGVADKGATVGGAIQAINTLKIAATFYETEALADKALLPKGSG